MSVRELKFSDGGLTWFTINEDIKDKTKMFDVRLGLGSAVLNRSQAHLLYLYLKERFEPK